MGWLFSDTKDEPAPPIPRPTAPPIGQWDHLEVFVGLRGHGKSTMLTRRALELAGASGGAYVIGHSLGARMPTEIDGIKVPFTYHETMEELKAGLRRDPGRWHMLVTGDADPVLKYARELSEAMRREAWYRAGNLRTWKRTRRMEGIACPPIIVLVDEGIALDAGAGGSQGNAIHRWFRDMLFSLRHEHIALLYSIQEANARSYLLLAQATVIYAFRTVNEYSLNALGAAGFRDQVDAIATLPRFEHRRLEVSAPKIAVKSKGPTEATPSQSDQPAVKPAGGT